VCCRGGCHPCALHHLVVAVVAGSPLLEATECSHCEVLAAVEGQLQHGDRDHHLVRQNVWEQEHDEDGILVSEGPASYLLGDVILPEGNAETNSKANEIMFKETGVQLKRQRGLTVDNCPTAAAEFTCTLDRHPDPDHFDHTGCDPHRLQLVLKALAHGTNGKKGDMHELHVEQLIYKVR
jgi:hypothetical protein